MLPTLETTIASVHVVVSLYGVALGVAAATGLVLAVRRARHPDVVLVAGSLVALAGVWGAGVLYRALDGGTGLASTGGVAAGLATIALAGRASGVGTRHLLDALAPAALVALGIGRVGCFLAGCCYGRPTDLPWGVVVPALGPPARHPVQLYAAVADVALAAWAVRAPATPGAAGLRAILAYGAARIVLECGRDPGSTDRVGLGGVTVPQAFGAALVVGSAAVLIADRRRRLSLTRSRFAARVGS
jgi:prolipoprotein diacylglyceryltransferase